jgi:hypothetical protein
MKWFAITAVALLESVAMIAIIRSWRQTRALGSVPLFGLVFYSFITVNPEAQADHTAAFTDT